MTFKFLQQPSTSSEQMKYFGLLMAVNYPLYYFVWSYHTPFSEEDMAHRACAFSTCLVFAFKDFLPSMIKKFLPFFWYITVTYCLPFFFTYMTLKNHCSTLWLMNDVTALFLLSILLNTKEVACCLIVGVYVAGLLFYYTGHTLSIIPGTISLATLAWTFAPPIILGIIFLQRRNSVEQEKIASMKALSGAIAHELRTPLLAIAAGAKGLNKSLELLLNTYHQALNAGMVTNPMTPMTLARLPHILTSIDQETRSAFNIIDMTLIKLKEPLSEKNQQICSMSACVQEALERYPFNNGEKSLIQLNLMPDFSFQGEKLLMVHVLFNLLKNALFYIQKANKGDINIWLTTHKKFNMLHFKDTGTGINKTDLPFIFHRFYSRTDQGTGIGLAFCQTVLQGMQGSITCDSAFGEYTHFKLQFPCLPSIDSGEKP